MLKRKHTDVYKRQAIRLGAIYNNKLWWVLSLLCPTFFGSHVQHYIYANLFAWINYSSIMIDYFYRYVNLYFILPRDVGAPCTTFICDALGSIYDNNIYANYMHRLINYLCSTRIGFLLPLVGKPYTMIIYLYANLFAYINYCVTWLI